MRTAPHFYLTAQIDMTALRDLRQRTEAEVVQAAGAKASMTVLIAYVVGRVLVEHPYLNASIEGEATRLHANVDIGIAMDRNGDLIVPVLRDVRRGRCANWSGISRICATRRETEPSPPRKCAAVRSR